MSDQMRISPVGKAGKDLCGMTGSARGPAAGDKTWTVLELLKWTTDYFSRSGIDSARLDAELLLAHALETERLRLYIDYEKPVLPEERDRYRALVQRRARERVPVSQLLGVREFWSLTFEVTRDVLTPRPETETLVEFALSKAVAVAQDSDSVSPFRILDVGTGSGAIALSLASELPLAQITATDLSKPALQIAAANADRLHTRERLRLLEGDLFQPVASERFDLIVSNPPYVARADIGSCPPELSHEPEMALFAGQDGLEVIRRLVAEAGDHLSPGGWLGIELSPEQTERVEEELVQAGFVDVERRFDLASRPRVVGARWPMK
ncbi:MAG: peptide chain release factor N(5)-glutamine methyltransferase [bacterium]|nr:peptide chain release factor N(5)-glutamine methyltransferase [bacterium]